MFASEKKEVLLSVKNVSKSYGEGKEKKKVLNNISFDIHNIVRPGILQGQIISLIGVSGCGKSTLFHILSGMEDEYEGEVLVNNKKISIGDMGVVFQDYYFFGWRKVKKILELAAKKNELLKDKAIRDKEIAAIVNELNLSEHLNKFSNQLSGGQRQRVAIAEQLLNGSNFLLLDEPFSGLDALMIDKVTNILTRITSGDELKTIIIVSHDISNSVAISDTVLVMKPAPDGSIISKEIDLISRDLAWRPGVKDLPEFRQVLKEIKGFM